ncbi:MAG: hypothetical protein PHC38_08945 [Weeksellaceae bacterium]|jgi:hypothetical protein|nr:hypothetical protein [Weeksellaceae bacterium]
MSRSKEKMTKSRLNLRQMVKIGVTCLVVVMMLSGCGGGSGSSGKRLASNEFLGDLPNVVYQHAYQDSVFRADKYAAEEKFSEPFKSGKKKLTESDWKKGAELEKEWDAKRKEGDAKLTAEVEKLKSSLVGKAVPYEVEDGAPFEIASCKIVDLLQRGEVRCEIEFKITDATAIQTNWSKEYHVVADIIDKDGNKFSGTGSTIVISNKENGAVYTSQLHLGLVHSPKEYVNFAKIRFLNKK